MIYISAGIYEMFEVYYIPSFYYFTLDFQNLDASQNFA